MWENWRGQISIDFITVYSVVLIIFVLVFVVLTGQRASVLNAQQASIAGIEAQEIASYIDHAVSAGSGYATTLSLAQGPGSSPYNIYVSTSGVVIINSTAGGQPVNAYAFSDGRNMSINGSLQFGSANGIGTYLIPAYTGVIRISNVGGTVYIDRGAVSNAGLLGSSILTDVQEGYVPYFSGTGSYVATGTNGLPLGANARSMFAWVYLTGPVGGTWYTIESYGNQNIVGDSSALRFESTSGHLHFVGAGDDFDSSITPTPNAWHFVGYTYAGGTSVTVYYDGQSQTGSITSALTTALPASDQADIGKATAGNTWNFPGYISDVQVYNASLSASAINTLYNEGIEGLPVAQGNLVAWWPLEGNPNDYGGNSNNGQSTNVVFQTAARLIFNVLAKNGTAISNNAVVGVVISNGIAGSSPYATHGSPTNGIFAPILLYNTINPNATVYSFNGNLSTSGNLIGWWPLSFGDLGGNTLYDLSSGNDNGIYNGITSWSPWALSRHFASASFPGNVVNGIITVNAVGSLLNITRNFTAVAWVKYNGGRTQAQPCQGIIGSGGLSQGGISSNGMLLMAKGAGASCGIFYAGGNSLVGNYPMPFNSLNWTMVSATWAWNGVAGNVYVFQNSTVVASGPLGLGTNSITPSQGTYYIGAQTSSASNTFNGLVSDAQLYSQTLGSGQIAQLYSEGPTGIPILGAGLVGWWPLTGSAADYSGGNSGVLGYNAAFGPANYTFSYNTTPAARVATFNGAGGIRINTGGRIPFNGPFSVSFWFSSYNSPSTPFDYELVDAKLKSGGSSSAYDVQLCGGGACYGGVTGLNGSVGTGTAVLSNTIFLFQFAARRLYNVVETFSTTGWSMYLNGANVSSGNYIGTPEIAGTADYIVVGGGSIAASNFYGQIADLQVYNAVLTSAQARQIYQQGVSPQSAVTLSMG